MLHTTRCYAFALAVPLVTTAVPGHGPEIDYLDDGTNGRFSRWLRIGAVGVLGVSGIVWWLSTL